MLQGYSFQINPRYDSSPNYGDFSYSLGMRYLIRTSNVCNLSLDARGTGMHWYIRALNKAAVTWTLTYVRTYHTYDRT